MIKVFIDGSAGTTGLRIFDRLSDREEICLITLPEELRKDKSARHDAINSADIVYLCLPDDAAIDAVTLLENKNTVIIDTSTAHRTLAGWIYGLPEIKGQREKIQNSRFIANPGCHAGGFVALIQPLVENNILKKDVNLSCFSLTGYSGGGKKMIGEYEDKNRNPLLDAPRQYALSQNHKHLKEMVKITGIENPPAFCPVVGSFYSGMQVTVPLFKGDIKGNISDIINIYKEQYNGIIHYDEAPENGFLSALSYSGYDDMGISVFGNEDRIILTASFDNLGKGASGSAIQNMNIKLGLDEATGLYIKMCN